MEDTHHTPRAANEWPPSYHAAGTNDQHLSSSIVQIIVPELHCLQQDDSNAEESLSALPSNSNLVMSPHENATDGMQHKDSLSALAAAAEMDHLRENVMHMQQDNQSRMESEKYEGVSLSGSRSTEGITIHNNDSYEVKMSSEGIGLPLAPFLNAADPDALFYNEIYHYVCSERFTEGSSEIYKKIIKRRAANYTLNENGTLSYGQKIPKQVLTDPREQREVLQASHIEKDTGVHIGVRKMYNMIFAKFYWRSMYVDISSYARQCEICSEALPSKVVDKSLQQEYESPFYVNRSFLLTMDRITKVWKKVVVQIHGPFLKTSQENEFIISIYDPFSKWIVAKASPKIDLLNNCSTFIFDSFCTFGFAQCQVVGLCIEEFNEVYSKYEEKYNTIRGILKIPLESNDGQPNFIFTRGEQTEDCDWTGDVFTTFTTNNLNYWDNELSKLLFKHSIENANNCLGSPFSVMFGRNATGYVSEEEKENISLLEDEKAFEVPSNRRKLRSSTLECRHCHETFTSKISFRIHQRKHTEEARRRGTLEGEEEDRLYGRTSPRPNTQKKSICKRKRKPFGRGPQRLLTVATSDWTDENSDTIPVGIRQHLTQTTVEAVRNLLIATKEERSKRGKYFKYSPELRDEIAKYALDHSIPAATTYWSERLGNTVSESTVRNFVKLYKSFSNENKEEIGRYAFHNGLDKATQHFKEKYGYTLRRGIILKFKKRYARIFCSSHSGENGNSASNLKKHAISSSCARQKRSFSHQIKEEIGKYANTHSISAAVEYFSLKLQFDVKESTVRKFRKQFLERLVNREPTRTEATNHEVMQVTEHQHSTDQPPIDVLNASLLPNVSATASGVSASNNFLYHNPYSLNMTASGVQTNTPVIPMNHNSLAFHQGSSIINQGISQNYQQNPAVIMNQPFAPQITPFHQGYIGGFAQAAPNGSTAPGGPITVTHTTVSPSSIPHPNSPLPLTMGGSHLSQLSSVASAHHLTSPPTNIQPHAPLQLVAAASTFHQSLPAGLTFESGGALVSHATVSNEPLSLMKENTVQDTTAATNIQPTATMTGVATSIVPEVDLSHLDTPSQQDHPQSEHPHHLQNQEMQHNAPPADTPQVNFEEEELMAMDDFTDPPKRKKARIKYLRSSYTCGKRGNYVSYSPEIRAEIGRYAAENGNLAAINYFKEKLDIDIPESTVRGLKDKYLIKMMRGEKEVKSLGFAQRGRPMRLGKYDRIVQDCIRELIKNGEKVSSFLVIATAKHVLMQYEPSLLEENGGQVKLNPTWAKSFLKRIGIQNHG